MNPARRAEFSLEGYGRLLDAFLEKGYEDRDFLDYEPPEAHLILRHDIDMSIASAVRIGEIEQKRGCRACYFVLLRSSLYNAFSDKGLSGLQALAAMGHRVRLHFDRSIYDADMDALDTAAAGECEILEAMSGRCERLGRWRFRRRQPRSGRFQPHGRRSVD